MVSGVVPGPLISSVLVVLFPLVLVFPSLPGWVMILPSGATIPPELLPVVSVVLPGCTGASALLSVVLPGCWMISPGPPAELSSSSGPSTRLPFSSVSPIHGCFVPSPAVVSMILPFSSVSGSAVVSAADVSVFLEPDPEELEEELSFGR